MRVLIAEDDPGLRSVLHRGFERAGYTVDIAADGNHAIEQVRGHDYGVLVLDWRMPGRSGLDVVKDLRREGNETPVIMLTARDTLADRVEGLDAGADDYLVKPFQLGELLARVRALLRRPPPGPGAQLAVGDLELDTAAHRLARDGEDLALTTRELAIMELLMRSHPAVVERVTMVREVWDETPEAVGANTIDVHMARLRAKIAGSSVVVDTVRGIGYRLVT